jgi:tetratricopeptide (TPR) repeat protein
MASVCERSGELKEAKEHCLQAMHIVEESAAADPTNIDLQRDLSICQSRLGDVARAGGDFETARMAYEKGLELDKAMADADPTNIQARKDLAISYQKIGDVRVALKDLAGASESFHSGAQLAEAVATADPADADSKRVLSIFYERLSGAPAGSSQAAREFGQKCLAIREALAASQPDNATAAFDLIAIQTHLGELDRMEQKYADALVWYDRALSRMHDLQKAGKLEGQPDRLKWIPLLEGQEALCRQAQTRPPQTMPAPPAATQPSP